MARQDENGSDEAGRVGGYGMGSSAACAAGASGVVVSGDDVATVVVVVVVVGTYGIDIGRSRVGQQLTGQRLAAAAAAAAAAAVVGCGCQGDRDPACIAGDCSSTRYDP